MSYEKIDSFLDEYSELCNKHKMFIGASNLDNFFKLRVCQDEDRLVAPAIWWDSKIKKFARMKNEQR